MMGDVATIFWKEWRELLAWRGNLRGGSLGLLVFAGVFGIYMPLMNGLSWIESPIVLVYWAWVPLMLVSSVVADSFAGERERHTLETLLASRLSDRAILFGKVAAAISYGWGFTIVLLLIGVLTLNIAYGQGQLVFYAPDLALSILVLTFLGSALVSCAGVLVSLRAATVCQAAQSLSVALLLLLFVPILGSQVLPEDLRQSLLVALASGPNPTDAVKVVAVGLAVLDLGLLLAAVARFKRSLLILG